MLDKDLFVHVSDAAVLRQRGWRPRGQACEGCGRRVWGPGAGGSVWDQWQQKTQEVEQMKTARTVESQGRDMDRSQRGKGKAVVESVPGAVTGSGHKIRRADRAAGDIAIPGRQEDGELGPLIVFSCRHIFHRACLEQLRVKEGGDDRSPSHVTEGPDFRCAVCA